jgi:hypothetical protein
MTTDAEVDTSRFETGDRLTIVLLCIIFLVVVAGFFFFVYWQGLTAYPSDRLGAAVKAGGYDYFAYALEYRERRLTLALTLRTFITSLGFIVGLVLSVIGGIFILRRARVDFTASGATGGGAAAPQPAVPATPDDATKPAEPPLASAARGVSFALATSSPGILFLIGGVIVMYVTQLLAIQIGAPEIFPRSAVAMCDQQQAANGSCYLDTSAPDESSAMQIVLTYCASRVTDTGCAALENLEERLGTQQSGGTVR